MRRYRHRFEGGLGPQMRRPAVAQTRDAQMRPFHRVFPPLMWRWNARLVRQQTNFARETSVVRHEIGRPTKQGTRLDDVCTLLELQAIVATLRPDLGGQSK